MTESVYIRNFRPAKDSTSNRVASFDIQYGPITIKGIGLIRRDNGGSWLSMPSVKSEKTDQWYDQVELDELLKVEIKNKIKLLIASESKNSADPTCPDQDVPY